MAVASSSSLRTLCSRSATVIPTRFASTYSDSPSYSPRPFSRNDDNMPPERPPRPSTSVFFTGRPQLYKGLNDIEDTIKSTLKQLRAEHIFPLPKHLTLPPAPEVRWKPAADMHMIFGPHVNMAAGRRINELLNELYRAGWLAELSGKADISAQVSSFLGKYQRMVASSEETKKKERSIDSFGRAHGAGKRKEASAEVWIIPSQSALAHLDVPVDPTKRGLINDSQDFVPPSGDFLVNHLPLPMHFQKAFDRESVLRPLRLTGLLGAYNVFALVHGGGPTGQSGAVSLALARALVTMRPDVRPVLLADGQLRRDPRMVERKKTNLHKARKARTWVKR